jgi:CBS domain-containing protein
MSPLLEPETTVKDALSRLLAADVLAGIVVDRAGAVKGMVTFESIAQAQQERAAGPDGPLKVDGGPSEPSVAAGSASASASPSTSVE